MTLVASNSKPSRTAWLKGALLRWRTRVYTRFCKNRLRRVALQLPPHLLRDIGLERGPNDTAVRLRHLL